MRRCPSGARVLKFARAHTTAILPSFFVWSSETAVWGTPGKNRETNRSCFAHQHLSDCQTLPAIHIPVFPCRRTRSVHVSFQQAGAIWWRSRKLWYVGRLEALIISTPRLFEGLLLSRVYYGPRGSVSLRFEVWGPRVCWMMKGEASLCLSLKPYH